MGKSEVRAPAVFECVAPFTVWRDGIPVTYAAGHKVSENDPIRRSHRDAFAVVTARPVEQATAAPGELRPVSIPTEVQPVASVQPTIQAIEREERVNAQVR